MTVEAAEGELLARHESAATEKQRTRQQQSSVHGEERESYHAGPLPHPVVAAHQPERDYQQRSRDRGGEQEKGPGPSESEEQAERGLRIDAYHGVLLIKYFALQSIIARKGGSHSIPGKSRDVLTPSGLHVLTPSLSPG